MHLVAATPALWPQLHALRPFETQRDFVPAPLELLREAAFPSFAGRKPAQVLAILGDTQPLGLLGHARDDDGHILFGGFLVDRRFQGRGIGGAAFEAFCRLLSAGDTAGRLLLLNVHGRNARALGFYRRRGFRRLSPVTLANGAPGWRMGTETEALRDRYPTHAGNRRTS